MKILTIQDISCVGQCSLTVAFPIISAFGVETCILPSAVLSTHTYGFSGYTFRDLTDDIPAIIKHWQKENISFNAIYTGYIGNKKQIDYILEMNEKLSAKDSLLIVDPAMADYGKLYYGFDLAFVEEMKKLVKNADYVLPNITESAFLLGEEYIEKNHTKEYIEKLCVGLYNLGAKKALDKALENNVKKAILKAKSPSCGCGYIYDGSFTHTLIKGDGVTTKLFKENNIEVLTEENL